MARSLRKFKNFNYAFFSKINCNQNSVINDLKNLKIRAIEQNWFLNKELFICNKKTDIILDYMVGLYLLVYVGNTYSLLYVRENMVNYRVGEFVITKRLGSQIHDVKGGKKKINK